MAYYHCNGVKNKSIYDDGLLNPVLNDPENYMSFEINIENHKENVIIKAKNYDKGYNDAINKTIGLLNDVYNNTSHRDNQKVSSAHLKNRLSKEIRDFYLLVDNYKSDFDSGDHDIIVDEISRKNEFAAFKRCIIRSDSELYNEFAGALMAQ